MSQDISTFFDHLRTTTALKPPLEIVSVIDRGIPGKERVNIRVHTRTELRPYFLLAGAALPNNRTFPITNFSLWLGEDTIDDNSWIIVYTGPGELRLSTQMKETKENVLVLHWGCSTTIFGEALTVPVLVRIDLNFVWPGKPGQ